MSEYLDADYQKNAIMPHFYQNKQSVAPLDNNNKNHLQINQNQQHQANRIKNH